MEDGVVATFLSIMGIKRSSPQDFSEFGKNVLYGHLRWKRRKEALMKRKRRWHQMWRTRYLGDWYIEKCNIRRRKSTCRWTAHKPLTSGKFSSGILSSSRSRAYKYFNLASSTMINYVSCLVNVRSFFSKAYSFQRPNRLDRGDEKQPGRMRRDSMGQQPKLR